MKFVSSLDIKGFRGVKECQEPLKFSKFNVLIGRNNSAKSTVLQALSLLPHYELRQPMDLSAKGVSARFDLVRALTGGSLVYRYAGEASLDFNFEGGKYCFNFDGKQWRSIIDGNNIVVQDACEHFGVAPEQAPDWAVFTPADSEFLERVRNALFTRWNWIEKSGSPVRVTREVINPVIDEVFTEVTPRTDGLYARKEVEGEPFYVNVRDLGAGIQKTLNTLLFLDACAPQLVLWDDFEMAAHPSLLRGLLRWLVDKDWQVVLATHSIDVLYELTEIGPEDASVMQLRKAGEDILTYRTLTVEDLDDFLSAGHDPRLLVDDMNVVK